MSEEKTISDLWQKWEHCDAYLQKLNLYDTVEKCIKFYEGNHWGRIAPNTKDLPRVTINQTEMIANSKSSGILQSDIKVTFFSERDSQRAEEMTRFNNFIEKEMKFNEICADVVEDASVVGCVPVYFYWDEDAIGKHGEYKGGLRCEQLDLLNIGVHNPKELDIQKQKWVILKTRQEVDAVKDMLENPENINLIQPDDDDRRSELDEEQEGSNFCTVLTRFFRKDGEVYFEKATKNCVIHGARPLNPNKVELKTNEDKEDAPRDNLSGEATKAKVNPGKRNYLASLYPIALYVYKKKKGCIYGRGEVEPIIMNNKVVNFSFAMMAKSIEDIGFGQVVAKEGAIGDKQRLSNDPTQILIDKYKGAGYGLYSLNKQPFPAQVPSAINAILESTRSVTGATEVMTGETVGANQSGTSIAYLQQQAQRPLNKLKERYKRFRERCAEIMVQFYILYYENKEYTYKKEDRYINPTAQLQALQMGIQPIPNNEYGIEKFNGKDYENVDFDIVCEAGAGSQWSELTELQMLEFALQQKQIDFKSFLKAYPSNLITNKDVLLKGIEETENGVLATAQNTIAQLQQQLAQCQAYIKQSNQVVSQTSSLIKKNRELESYFAQLQNEYSNKINLQNNQLAETTQDASDFAQQILASKLAQQGGQTDVTG